mmetsp:Transcript_57018/g.121075  ORF Transcript_57018/g.121075 Transcript_57018/m.121075 type:complete len:88 (+) Transcript_57018:527-790(+)
MWGGEELHSQPDLFIVRCCSRKFLPKCGTTTTRISPPSLPLNPALFLNLDEVFRSQWTQRTLTRGGGQSLQALISILHDYCCVFLQV